MNSVIKSVITLLKDALLYVPAGCVWAAGIVLIIFIACMIYKFCFHREIRLIFLWKLFLLFLFIVYTYCILQLTILSRPIANYGEIDWRILARWNENTAQKAFLIANIIMFVPLGILLPMLCRWARHILLSMPAALLCSITIEAVQLKYQLGFCQLDDVIANSTGFLAGFLIYLATADIYCLIYGLFKLISRMATKD